MNELLLFINFILIFILGYLVGKNLKIKRIKDKGEL